MALRMGPAELAILGFIGLVALAALALPIYSLVDTFRRPETHWIRSGQNQWFWAALIDVGMLVCPVGLVGAIVYLAADRPKLDQYGSWQP